MIAVLPGAVLVAQLSAGAIVARAKNEDMRIRDLEANAQLEILSGGERKTRRMRLSLKRDGVNYRALFEILEPRAMTGTKFLVQAERGKRNREWAYFPDLDLVRSIPGKSQDDAFLGSEITYADLAGGAHLDDLLHRLVGEVTVDGEECYLLEGTPRHEIVYGKLRGYVRKTDFVTVKAEFFDSGGRLVKQAHLTDVRDLGGGIELAYRIEMRNVVTHSVSVLTLSDVRVNQDLSLDDFTADALPGRSSP